jgi:2-oxoisovalerate dehydrogenase E1 component
MATKEKKKKEKPVAPGSTEILEKAFEYMAIAKALTDIYEANFKEVSKYVHATSRGHEAVQIALGMQLTPDDWLSAYYRDDAILLSIGMSPYALMLQLMAKKMTLFSWKGILFTSKLTGCR